MKEYIMKPDAVWIEDVLYDGKPAYGDRDKEDALLDGFLVLPEVEGILRLSENQDNLYCGEWHRETKEEWWDALEVLPPMMWRQYDWIETFFISEAMTDNIHSCHVRLGDEYFTVNRRTTDDPNDWVEQIRKQFGEK